MVSENEGLFILKKVAKELIKNFFFYGVGAFIVVALGGLARWLAVVLFAAYCLVIALSVAQTIFTTGLGLIVSLVKVVKRQYDAEEAYLTIASVVKIIEDILMLGLGYFVYARLFS